MTRVVPAGLLERSPRGPEEPCHAVPAPSVDLAPLNARTLIRWRRGPLLCDGPQSPHTLKTRSAAMMDRKARRKLTKMFLLLKRTLVINVAAHCCVAVLKTHTEGRRKRLVDPTPSIALPSSFHGTVRCLTAAGAANVSRFQRMELQSFQDPT